MQTMSPSITKLTPALLAAQKAMGDAKKGASNPYFKSTYADLNAIREVAIPVLNSVGIAVLQPTVTHGDKNYVCTTLLHESGEYLTSLTEIKNSKGTAQDEGSGISYARRYGLQAFLNIGAVDDDGESTMDRKTDKAEPAVVKSSYKKAAVASPATAAAGVAPKAVTNGAQTVAADGGDDW